MGVKLNYFITSRISKLTSAIELAEIKRLNIFDNLGQQAMIITKNKVWNQRQTWQDLNIHDKVLNMFDYFQHTMTDLPVKSQDVILDIQGTNPNFNFNGLVGYKDSKKRVEINLRVGKLYYVNYLDRFGFTDRRDFYNNNLLDYSEFYDDGAKLITRTYYDADGKGVLNFYYRGGPDNQPILTLIHLLHHGRWLSFDGEDGLMAYFLDCLSKKEAHATFFSDREEVTLKAFDLMTSSGKKYVVLHSAFTENARVNGKLFYYMKEMSKMKGKIDGIISATHQESQDVQDRFPEIPSYAIPVSFIENNQLDQEIEFEKRIPFQIIAVARLTNVKRLDHLIRVVLQLKEKFKSIDLKIYGYDDSWNDYQTSTSLRKLVNDAHAGEYVHFCGYQHDLTDVYRSADVEVLTSYYEGFSMAILEALGSRCPVVSYDIHYGPAEMIKDGINGKLVPAGDEFSLYQTLWRLLSSRTILRQMSENCPKTMERFSRNSVQAEWKRFLLKENLIDDDRSINKEHSNAN